MKVKFKILKKAWLVSEHSDAHIGSEVIWADTAGQAKKAYVNSNWGEFNVLKARRAYSDDKVEFDGTEQYRWAVVNSMEGQAYRLRGDLFSLAHREKSCYIWSGEHGAYWREGAAGYTTEQKNAGVYSVEEAWGLVRHCGPEKRIELKLVTN